MSNQIYRMKEIDNEKSKIFYSLEKQSIHKSFKTHEAGFSGRFIVPPNSEELTAESVFKIETPKKNRNKESYKVRIDNQRDREKLESIREEYELTNTKTNQIVVAYNKKRKLNDHQLIEDIAHEYISKEEAKRFKDTISKLSSNLIKCLQTESEITLSDEQTKEIISELKVLETFITSFIRRHKIH